MELAAQESDQAAQDAWAQLARLEAPLSKLEEWRRPADEVMVCGDEAPTAETTEWPPRSSPCAWTPATTQHGRDAPLPAIAG